MERATFGVASNWHRQRISAYRRYSLAGIAHSQVRLPPAVCATCASELTAQSSCFGDELLRGVVTESRASLHAAALGRRSEPGGFLQRGFQLILSRKPMAFRYEHCATPITDCSVTHFPQPIDSPFRFETDGSSHKYPR